MVRKIREAGGEYKEGLTRDVTMLVTAVEDSTKMRKARDMGTVKIITVEKFRDMLK